MLKPNRSKQIIVFFLALFLASSVYLFVIDSRYNDPQYGDSWYALSFVDPKSDSLDFTLENFSAEKIFHWEILADKEKISEGNIEIQSGEKKEINSPEILVDKKITVRVSAGNDTQEIYKNVKN